VTKTISIDFDGVIHRYSKGWHDGTIYDEPMEGAFEYIKRLMDEGYCVYVLSTRSPRQIKKWLDYHLWRWDSFSDNDQAVFYSFKPEVIPFWVKTWQKQRILGITNRKLPAVAYIDDKAVRFEGRWDMEIDAENEETKQP